MRERLSVVALGAPVGVTPSRRASRSPDWLRRSALVGGAVVIAVLAITAAAHTPGRRDAARPAVSGSESAGPRTAAMAVASAMSLPPAPAEGQVRSEATAIAAATSLSSAAVAHRSRRRSRTPSPARAAERARAATGSVATQGCDPPYTLNAAGERQFKLRCLVDVRR